MKVLYVLALALLAFAAANTEHQHKENKDKEESKTERSHPLVEPPTQEQQCALCRSTWKHAVSVYNSVEQAAQMERQQRQRGGRVTHHTRGSSHRIQLDDQAVRTGDGVITEDKVCRSICHNVHNELKKMDEQDLQDFTCNACSKMIRFLRRAENKRELETQAREKMCSRFATLSVREDCGHTVSLYANNIEEQIRYGMSSRSICRQYAMCGGELRENHLSDIFNLKEGETEVELRAEDVKDLQEVGFEFN